MGVCGSICNLSYRDSKTLGWPENREGVHLPEINAGNILTTCWQHAGNMLAIYWQHAGNMQATRGQQAATCWQHAGNTLWSIFRIIIHLLWKSEIGIIWSIPFTIHFERFLFSSTSLKKSSLIENYEFSVFEVRQQSVFSTFLTYFYRSWVTKLFFTLT